MAVLIMFEKDHKGGLLRCMYDQNSVAPFNFWFIRKNGKSLLSPLSDNIQQCWEWLDAGMKE